MRNQILLFLLITVLSNCSRNEISNQPWTRHAVDASSQGADGVRLTDVNHDGLPDIATGWEEGGVTRVYLHPGVKEVRDPWPMVTVGITPSVEDAVFADPDGNGVMDVVSCCEGNEKRVYIHWAPAGESDYLDPDKWITQPVPATINRMQWMFCLPMDIDGKNGVDLVCGGKGKKAQLGWLQVPADARDVEKYQWHPITPVGWVMSIIERDMDDDGDGDILISDRYGDKKGIRWLEKPDQDVNGPWRENIIGATDVHVMFISLADMDGDGGEEILAAVKEREIIIFKHLGSGIWAEERIPFPENTGTAKAADAADLDKDGIMDLVFSCEQAEGDLFGIMWMKKNGGTWTARDVSGASGIKYDRLELLDLDHDGDMDILTCEERQGGGGLGVIWYENPL